MRRHTFIQVALVLVLTALVSGCADIQPMETPPVETGRADFTRLVAIGNSLTAGFSNNGLNEIHQRRSYAALVAGQVGKEILSRNVTTAQVGQYVIPGYGAPGSSGTLELISLVPPNIVEIPEPGNPVNLAYPAAYNQLAVPGANVDDVLHTVTKASNPLYDLILRGGGTILQQASALQPTFILLWVGPNDVLGAALDGTITKLTPLASFESDYRSLLDQLEAIPTHPDMVAANIPDVTDIPFVTTVPPFVVDPTTNEPVRNPLTGGLIPLIGPDGPLALPGPGTPGDFVTIRAIPLLRQGYGLPPGIPGANGQPLPDAVVLNRSEAGAIQQQVDDMNGFIADEAAARGFPVVDINVLLTKVNSPGIEYGGIHYDATFVTGGIFSLDGFHPTDVGQIVVANAFIEAINRGYDASIPLVDASGIMGVDFTPLQSAPGAWWLGPETAAAVTAMENSVGFRAIVGD
jgi:hypothetical protein